MERSTCLGTNVRAYPAARAANVRGLSGRQRPTFGPVRPPGTNVRARPAVRGQIRACPTVRDQRSGLPDRQGPTFGPIRPSGTNVGPYPAARDQRWGYHGAHDGGVLSRKRVAAHARSSSNRRHTTVREHMPSSHRRCADLTPESHEPVGRPESNGVQLLLRRTSTAGAAGALMVRVEVGSGCETPNATRRANHDDRQNCAEGAR